MIFLPLLSLLLILTQLMFTMLDQAHFAHVTIRALQEKKKDDLLLSGLMELARVLYTKKNETIFVKYELVHQAIECSISYQERKQSVIVTVAIHYSTKPLKASFELADITIDDNIK